MIFPDPVLRSAVLGAPFVPAAPEPGLLQNQICFLLGSRRHGRRSCAIEQHNPAGWETRHYEPMKTVNNSSETASPRGGVGSIVKRTQSTATQVNTIRLPTWTSLRVKGEVLEASARQALGKETEGPCHGGPSDALGVVGGSRLGKGSACEDGRPGRTDRWQQRRPGVNRSAAEIASEAIQ